MSGADTDHRNHSLETALGYLDCLRGFRAKLVETDDGRHQVKITMYGAMDIYAVLDAIDRHVTERPERDPRDLDGALLSEPAGGD
jgi:hypothetical protein